MKGEIPLRKALIASFVAALLDGPVAGVAHAGLVCDLQEKLGVNNVKECEDYWP